MNFSASSSIVSSQRTQQSVLPSNSQAICQQQKENPLKRDMDFSPIKSALTKRSIHVFPKTNSISNEQKRLIETTLDIQRNKFAETLNSPHCSSELRQLSTTIFKDILLLFRTIEQSATAEQACWFLKMAEERVLKETNALLAILRPPLVSKFESQWVAIAEYVQRTVLSELGNPAPDARKRAISESLLAFASEMDVFRNQHSSEITNAFIQEFFQKSNQQKAHLLSAASAVRQAQCQKEIDSALVALLNHLEDLKYPISSEQSLVEQKIFSIPDDLFRLRRQLGESIFRP